MSTDIHLQSVRTEWLQVDDATLWAFVVLEASDGLVGRGESMLGGAEPAVGAAIETATQPWLGRALHEIALPRPALATERPTGLLEATVHAALDQALWDLRARALGLPIYAALGPCLHRHLPLYANINRGTRDRSPEGFAARASAAAKDGFDGVKIAPFDGLTRANAGSRAAREAFEVACERVEAVRDAIGFERRLMVDCHWRLQLHTALKFLRRIEPCRLDWFEDPLPYAEFDGWAALRATGQAPLVGGETARGIRDLLPFLDRGLLDCVMPDVRYFGGITELHALTPLATEYQVRIAPHNPRGPVGTLASAHAVAGSSMFDHLEFQYGECDWRAALTNGTEDIRDGTLHLSDAAGLGLAWNNEVAAPNAISVRGPR